MSLEHILLGMLRDPASGYDLRKAFDAGPRRFWSAHLGQIYPALQHMERRRWLSSARVPSKRGPARRVYRRTPVGARALHRWLRSPPAFAPERLAYVGQLVFLAELHDPDRTAAFLGALRAQFESSRRLLVAAERSHMQSRPKALARWSDDDFHELLCIRLGAGAATAHVAACSECLTLLASRRRSSRRRRRPRQRPPESTHAHAR